MGACAFVRRLRARSSGASEEVVELAVRQRAEAESKWRAAKPPTRISVRLSRASASLDRAFRAKEEADEALADFDARTALQRGKLVDDLAKAKERIVLHQAKVDDLRAESGTISSHTPKLVLAACRAARVVGAGLGAQSVPRLQAALELLECPGANGEEHQTACGELHLLLRDLQSFEHVCRKGYEEGQFDDAERYDIGDDDGDDSFGIDDGADAMVDVHGGQLDDTPGDAPRSGSARLGANGRDQPARWARHQGATWKKARTEEETGGVGTDNSNPGTAHSSADGPRAGSSLGQPSPPPPSAEAAAAAATPPPAHDGTDATGREMVGATPGELQALVQERQNNGDWEATQTLLAQQEAMAAEQRRRHRAPELADAARDNGIHLDPAAFSWTLQDLESWAKENGMQ